MTAVAALLLSACGLGASSDPWDRQVEGATSATGWIVESPIGADGEVFDTPDAILEMVREVEMGIWSARADQVNVGTIGDQRDETLVGYATTTFPERSHALRAVDVRFEMQQVDTGWVVVRAERRYQCAAETATELCQ
jgi:hypothetical protein